jgi:hypothetical protein
MVTVRLLSGFWDFALVDGRTAPEPPGVGLAGLDADGDVAVCCGCGVAVVQALSNAPDAIPRISPLRHDTGAPYRADVVARADQPFA